MQALYRFSRSRALNGGCPLLDRVGKWPERGDDDRHPRRPIDPAAKHAGTMPRLWRAGRWEPTKLSASERSKRFPRAIGLQSLGPLPAGG